SSALERYLSLRLDRALPRHPRSGCRHRRADPRLRRGHSRGDLEGASAHGGVTVAGMEKAFGSERGDISEPAGCTVASWPMWQVRASARMGTGRWIDARYDVLAAERVVDTDERRALCRNNAAWASLMSGDPALRASALELAKGAMAIQPDRPSIKGTYAFALLDNGSPAQAAALLESAAPAQLRPRDRATDLCLLAICQARLHQLEAGAKNLQAARDADPKCALLARAQQEWTAVPTNMPAG